VSLRDVSSVDFQLFGDIVARFGDPGSFGELHPETLTDIARLLRADYAASYVWCGKSGTSSGGVAWNMESDHVKRYEKWFQYRDPMTRELRQRCRATPVDAVISSDALSHTEFFNDFLARDGLHHGMSMFVVDGARDVRDFRIWRAKGKAEFSPRDIALLDALEPFARRSLRRSGRGATNLTPREAEVANLVARGCTDRDIGRVLKISFATVRTHINNAMQKHGYANRAELAALVARCAALPAGGAAAPALHGGP
jgi:DNA-binding NarL/FixJ family response regulator